MTIQLKNERQELNTQQMLERGKLIQWAKSRYGEHRVACWLNDPDKLSIINALAAAAAEPLSAEEIEVQKLKAEGTAFFGPQPTPDDPRIWKGTVKEFFDDAAERSEP